MKKERQRAIFFLLFACSGFSGLIYESIWTHYLKLFLGHAAYAQTLVLAIFMGGMALGSLLCSRYSLRWRRLLLGYAVAEGAIGVAALLFHPLFDRVIQFSYAAVIPQLGSPVAINAYKWGLSTLLILPQSILLGMTFPLMSSALIRIDRQQTGGTIAHLYFANSIGAVAGVLVSGFALVRFLGLPGTICFAGMVNIALALIVVCLVRGNEAASAGPGPENGAAVRLQVGSTGIFLLASLVTGAASFIYEIVWIRMLNLVLGSSTHAFELMLSAFILGLACGGLWIKRRIDSIDNPVRFFALVQVVMGLLALATLPLYGATFETMHWLMKVLPKTDTGYLLFNFSSHAIASAIMLPATFCAGMTLPLITYTLLRRGHGERSIGEVYGANTVGAIVGVFFAIHLGFPLLGMKGLLVLGAGLDLALGVGLAWGTGVFHGRRFPLIVTSVSTVAVAAVLLLVRLDPYMMASGVYRSGELMRPGNAEVIFHEDGKTATVSLIADNGLLGIRTNGKTDASVNMLPDGASSGDELTMALAGIMPLAFKPDARSAANIGLGSGITTNTLLSAQMLEQVDTVEIEQKIVKAARNFGPFSQLVYTDPKSRIYIDDAKTFFSSHNKKYDIIVSEPSNPWVSGVASLFTDEFYQLVKRHMTDDGVFVQWIQLYEINPRLVASVFKAIEMNFSDYAAYFPNYGDLLIVCRKNGTLGTLDGTVLGRPIIAQTLKRLHINSLQDIEIRRLGDRRMLAPFMASFPVRKNSDYFPVLDQESARSRYIRDNALDLQVIVSANLPVADMLADNRLRWNRTAVTPEPYFLNSRLAADRMALRDYYITGSESPEFRALPQELRVNAVQLRNLFYDSGKIAEADKRSVLYNGGIVMLPQLSASEMEAIWRSLERGPDGNRLSGMEREYLSFFMALGKRDASRVAEAVDYLLKHETDMKLPSKQYLVAAGMLAHEAKGNREEARKLWERSREELFGTKQPNMLFRFLAAHCGAAF